MNRMPEGERAVVTRDTFAKRAETPAVDSGNEKAWGTMTTTTTMTMKAVVETRVYLNHACRTYRKRK